MQPTRADDSVMCSLPGLMTHRYLLLALHDHILYHMLYIETYMISLSIVTYSTVCYTFIIIMYSCIIIRYVLVVYQ